MSQSGAYLDNSVNENFGSFYDFDDSRRIKWAVVVVLCQHPVVTFFHIIFRLLALLVYLLCGSDSFIGSFVSVVLLLSLDFWTVKNITGRIMVGLRWWNYINEAGESVWVFEARNGETEHRLSATEIRIFWAALIGAPMFWVLFFFTALFGFKWKWLVLVAIGLSLSFSNLLGYMRCKLGKTDSVYNTVTGYANTYFQQRMMQNVMNVFKSSPQQQRSQTQSI